MKKTYNNRKPKVTLAEKTKIQTFPFIFFSVLFILIHLFVSLSPTVERGWGVNFVRFFDPAVICLFYTVMIAVCLPPVNKVMVDFFTSITQKKIVDTVRKYKTVLFILIAVGAGFAFHELQVKYVFLGDVGIRPAEIEEGKTDIRGEYLTMLILTRLYTWLNSHWTFSGLQTIQTVSYISGSLFVLISLLMADITGKSLKQKTACFVLSTLSLAALMQFCGYSETYAMDLLLLQLYVYLSILHLQNKAHIIFPIVAMATGIVAHYMLAYMLPSLVFLFYRSVLWKHPFFRKKNTLILLSILAVIFAYHVFISIALPVMLPFSSENKNIMTLFSIAHYKEFINAQILGGGFVFVIWVALLFFYVLNKNIKFTAIHWFLSILSCSVTGFLFMIDLWRGSGDWDISSFGAAVTNFTAAFLLLDLHRQKTVKNIKYGVCVMAVFSMMHTSLWIVTNATDKSIGWVEKAFEKDPAVYYKNSFSNESMLGAIFSSNNLKEKSLYWEKRAYLCHQNDPRTGYNYANVLIREGKINEAIQIYESSVSKFPAYALPYVQLAGIYINNKDYDALYRLLLKMEEIYREKPEVFTSRLSREQINSCFDILNQLRDGK
ncbi:MAG: tetratricopeptide repeat protein [Dysgonamonadaceae bacterium]|jgi:hypothetical protein|nr:tetratricopeptide repeat protein [Dysgonamonadaceae bacterium]